MENNIEYLRNLDFARLSENNQTVVFKNYKDAFLFDALTSSYESVRELAFSYGLNRCVSSYAVNLTLKYLMMHSNKEDLIAEILEYWKFDIEKEVLEELSIRSNPKIRLAVAKNPDTPTDILKSMFKDSCYYYIRQGEEKEIDAILHNPNFPISFAENYLGENILAEYHIDAQKLLLLKIRNAMDLSDIFIKVTRDMVDSRNEDEFIAIVKNPKFSYNKMIEHMLIKTFPEDYKWIVPKIQHILESNK